jgi:hypothetical protein
MNYRSFPDDLRPSHAASLLAHIGGSTVEIALPLVLLFSTNPTVTLLAVIGMVGFHLFILSTFPLAVPLGVERPVRLCATLSRPTVDDRLGPVPSTVTTSMVPAAVEQAPAAAGAP